MRKKMINEYDGVLLGVDIIFYVIFIVIGSILLEFQNINYNETTYAIPIFYALGFFSLVSYFINRRPDDYEFLFFGLINIVTATYISNNYFYYDEEILGLGICVYTLAVALNKGYFTKCLMNKNDNDMLPKLISVILLTILGMFVSYHFVQGMTVESLLLGYYFIGFGLFGLFEPLLKITIRIPVVKKYLDIFLSKENDMNENKKDVENKISKVRKPIKKEITKINKSKK